MGASGGRWWWWIGVVLVLVGAWLVSEGSLGLRRVELAPPGDEREGLEGHAMAPDSGGARVVVQRGSRGGDGIDVSSVDPRAGTEVRVHGGGRYVVVDPEGWPVAGASLLVSEYGNRVFTGLECCSDDEGVVRWGGDSEGRSGIALHPLHRPSPAVSMEPAGELRLGAGAPAGVRCRVVRGGNACEATVVLRPTFRDDVARIVLRAGRSGLELEGLWPGVWELFARADGEGVASRRESLEAGTTTEVWIELEDGARVSGAVVDARGVAVPEALVDARQEHAGGLYVSTRADASGAFVLGALHPGPVAIGARDGEGAEARATLDLSGGSTAHVRLVLSRGLEIAGRVEGLDGEPLAGLSVVVPVGPGAWSRQGATDEAGRFVLTSVPESVVPLEVRDLRVPDRRVLHRSEAEAGRRDVVLVVDPARPFHARLRARVVRADGHPVGRFEVSVGAREERIGTSFRVDEPSGELFLDALEPGPSWVAVLAEHALPHQEEVQLVAGGEVDLGTVTLAAAGGVVCEVDGAGDRSDLQCRLWPVGDERARRLAWVESSRAVVENLAPGTYEVVLCTKRDSRVLDRTTIVVVPRERVALRLSASR